MKKIVTKLVPIQDSFFQINFVFKYIVVKDILYLYFSGNFYLINPINNCQQIASVDQNVKWNIIFLKFDITDLFLNNYFFITRSFTQFCSTLYNCI